MLMMDGYSVFVIHTRGKGTILREKRVHIHADIIVIDTRYLIFSRMTSHFREVIVD